MATATATQQPINGATTEYNTNFQQKNDISKDEVGWYFVEQYYITMSRSPEKLHLFYSRRSQLVFGTEAQTVPVAIGQKVCPSFFPLLVIPSSFAPIAKLAISYRPSMKKSDSLISTIAKSVYSTSIPRHRLKTS